MNMTGIEKIIRGIINNRARIIGGVVILTLFFGFFISKIKVNNDPTASVPSNLKELVDYQNLQKVFSSPRNMLLIAEFSDIPLLARIDSIGVWAARFDSIEGVDNVIHLGVIRVPVSGGLFGLNSEPIVTRTGAGSEEEVRARIRENREFTRGLISDDESVLGMIMDIDDSRYNQVTIVGDIVDLQNKLNKTAQARIYVAGSPLYVYSIDRAMKRDFSILLPICLLVVGILLYWIFRRLLYVAVSLTITAVALIWTFGLMGILGMQFSVVTSMIPVILFPIGVASAIHVFKTYSRHSIAVSDSTLAIQMTFRELMKPIFLSAITTFAGFASFSFSRIIWTRTFGIFAGIGVALALLLSIVILPICLIYEKKSGNKDAVDKKSRHEMLSFWRGYENFIFGSYNWTLCVLVIIAVGIVGFLRVKVEGNPIAMFPKNSDIRLSDDLISRHLGGTRFLTILLENKKSKILREEEWSQVQSIVDHVEKIEMVGGSMSLLSLINRTSMMLSDKKISNAALAMILGSKSLLGKKFQKYIDTWITPDRTKTKITLICKNVTGTQFVKLSKKLEGYIEKNYPDWKALVAGPPVLNDAMTYELIKTQAYSLMFSFFSVFLVLCLIFRSVKIGFISIIPIILSTLFVYALMGIFNVAVNTVTVIIVNTCIGIGIDYSIHFVAGFQYVSKTQKDRIRALMETAKIRGTVIMFNTFVVGIGFLVLVLSSFPPIRDFGIFVFISMVASSTFSLIFLPALFKIFMRGEAIPVNG